MLYGGVQMWRAHSSEGWPRTSGEIVCDQIDASEAVNKQRGTLTTRGKSYGAYLVYRYPVGGRPYYSNVRRFGQLSGADADWADAIAAKYPAGSRFPVSYSTVDPQLAVLKPGLSSEALWLPGAGLAGMLFGLAVMVFARRALANSIRHCPSTSKAVLFPEWYNRATNPLLCTIYRPQLITYIELVPALILQYSYLQVLDFLTTVAFLLTGVQEGNPLVRFALESAPTPLSGLIMVKLSALLLGFYCLRMNKTKLLSWINVLFAAVVAWNMVALIIGACQRPL